jgi:hypothetical protein
MILISFLIILFSNASMTCHIIEVKFIIVMLGILQIYILMCQELYNIFIYYLEWNQLRSLSS